MSKRQCPRCGKAIPRWQTVHLPCVFARLGQRLVVPMLVVASIVALAALAFFGRYLLQSSDASSSPSTNSDVERRIQLSATVTEVRPSATPEDDADDWFPNMDMEATTKVGTHTGSVTASNTLRPTSDVETPSSSSEILATLTRRPSSTPSRTMTRTSSHTPSPTATRPPSRTPTRPPRTVPPSDALTIGSPAVIQTRNNVNLNLRSKPTTNSTVVASLEPGTVVVIIEGPSYGDDYTWWHVALSDGRTGWVVESINDFETLVPATSEVSHNSTSRQNNQRCGGQTTSFSMEQTVVVSQRGDNLRILVDIESGRAIGLAVTGDRLEIRDGPECAILGAYGQNAWYWYVYSPTDNAYGWVCEGPRSERWLCPLSNPNCDR